MKKQNILFSPIAFFGSKRKEVHHIENNQPLNFNKFIDVFGGGGNVALYYHQKGHKTIYNDIHKPLTDLMHIIQSPEKSEELINKVKNLDVGIDKEKIKLVRDNYINTPTIEYYLLLLRYSMRGMVYSGLLQYRKDKKTGTYKQETRGDYTKIRNYPPLFENNKMIVTNNNYIDVINKYKDDENAFLYLDPPYLSTNCGNYAGVFFVFEDITNINNIMNDDHYKCKIMLHIEFLGYTYSMFKNQLKHYYPKRYEIQNKNIYQRYIMIATNY